MTDPGNAPQTARDPSVGQLMTQLSEQTSRLVRDELQLAQIELKHSAKHAGLGVGLFSGGGVLALFGFGALVTAAIAALDLAWPLWLAAVVVAAALLLGAGFAALLGRRQVRQGVPSLEHTVDSVKHDIEEVQEARRHDHT